MAKEMDRYTYRVTWSEEDQEYVGLCAEFSSLSWLEKSPEKALTAIRRLVHECITDMRTQNEEVPEPISTKNYSGKFMVRIPPQTHRILAIQAAESGVSLNRLVSSKLYWTCNKVTLPDSLDLRCTSEQPAKNFWRYPFGASTTHI